MIERESSAGWMIVVSTWGQKLNQTLVRTSLHRNSWGSSVGKLPRRVKDFIMLGLSRSACIVNIRG